MRLPNDARGNGSEPKRRRGTGIVKVGSLFEKYRKTLRAPQKSVIAAFCAALEELFEIRLSPDRCSYNPRSRTLSVQASGMVKTKVAIEKRHILNYLRETLGERSAPKDIL
ncbi:MAG TPA: hypothetical protein VFS75_01565 [Candidatus Paceibacterota bacterium]|nr:hypothetical protein [Candidatus Paceibacterota bacterium]